MFLRFTINDRNCFSPLRKGLFSGTCDLIGAGKIAHFEDQIEEVFDWFNDNLPYPKTKRREYIEIDKAICWFTPDAGECLNKMWELAALLEVNEIDVRLYKTKDPGLRIYTDPYQIMAIPQGKQKRQVRRVR